MRKRLADIFVPDHSRGLMVDATVLQDALGVDAVRILPIPVRSYLAANNQALDISPQSDLAIFVERLFIHDSIPSYSRRVLLANPEWLTARDVGIARDMVTELWHKTHFGARVLGTVFPDKRHEFIGFTSFPLGCDVSGFEGFSHFPGKSKTRHTQDIIDLWFQDEGLPHLSLQAYGGDLSLPVWVNHRNLRVFLGFLEEEEYMAEFARNGIHLCTSQMEGFGHYINEARSAGALVITLDAPPMNELIDRSCGILIRPERTARHHSSIRFFASADAIKAAVLQASEMPLALKTKMGERAKARFIQERADFLRRLSQVVRGV